MLKIGTDCSGIEAPIQALKKLKIQFSHLFSCEIDKYARESINANYNPQIIFQDIQNRNLNKVPYVDIYVCGFPCQSFSQTGYRLGFDDERGTVFFTCFKLIKKINPKVFILENVKGLLNHDSGKTFKTIKDKLSTLTNYNVYYQVLNTKDYGIPQNRERIFIIGLLKSVEKIPFTFPTKRKMKNINKFVDKKDNNSREIPPRIQEMKYMSKIPKDSVFVDFCSAGRSYFPNSGKYCSCIMKNSRMWCVVKSRYANCKELLSLQGFPKNFKQVVSNTQLKQQIGNSMSVNVLECLFKQIFKSMDIF